MLVRKLDSGTFVVRITRLGEQAEYGIEEIIVPPFESHDGRSQVAFCAALEEASEKVCGMNVSVTDLKGKEIEDPRKGQIALAMFKSQLMAEGIRLRPNELRSEIGNKIKTLNEQHPGLDLQFDEALEFVREILEEALTLAFKPKNKP